MKSKTKFATSILLGSALLITLGCQIASQTQSVPVSDPALTSAPAGSPAQTLPPTEISEMDISSAVLMLGDLPSGFEEINPEELGMSVDDFSNEDFKPEKVFMFVNSQDFQMVFGFNFLLTNGLDRVGFDMGMSQPELTLPAMVNGMGSENVRDEKLLEGFEDIGEKRIGMTMVANMEGIPVQVDVLMFRRDVVGAMVMSMTLEGQTPNITIHDLGLKLDQRVQENLQTLK